MKSVDHEPPQATARQEPLLRMNEEHFRTIFEGVGFSIWVEDFTDVKALIDTLAAEGVCDFGRYLVEHPEVVKRAIGLVKIHDVNPATVEMFGATSRTELLQSLHKIFLPETSMIFLEELVAIAENKQLFKSETIVKTLRGERLNVLLTINFPPRDQAFDRVVVTLADITERKRAEEALRESEERYRSLTEASTSIVWMTDATGRFVMPQPGWTTYTGQSWEQLRDLGWLEAIHPDDRETIRSVWEAACVSETLYQSAGRLWHAPSRTYRHFEGRGVPIRDGEGSVREWIGKCIDVEDHKRAEKELRESEERFARFMQHLPGLAWIKDLQGRYVYANEAAELVFQTPPEKLYGKTDEEIFPEEIAARFKKNDREALISQTGVRAIETLKHQDGVLHYSIVNKFPILGPDGQPLLIGGIAIDITDRKQAEHALLESETEARRLLELNQTIMSSMGEGLFTIDSQGLVTYMNPEAERLFGWKSGELMGRPMHEMTHYKHPDGSPFPIEECAGFQVRGHGKILRNFEDTFIRKDGSFFPVSYSSSPFRDHDGEIAGMVIVFQDITDRKQAEEELRRWKDELEVRVGERTSELLATQDRLRSLASQLILTEEHQRRKLARDLHDYLAQLLVVGGMKLDQLKQDVPLSPEAEVLTQELEDILQQALIYSRTTIAELSPPAFHEAGLFMSLKWLAGRMEKYGLRVEVHTNDQTFELSEDRVILLFQSVRELLFNVLKHAGSREVTVQVIGEQGGEVCIAVEDYGKGLDADAMQRAMEPGHLGLFAVRERMGAMGGRVELMSTHGEGTRVRLVLPAYGTSPAGTGREQRSKPLAEQASPQERLIVQAPSDDSVCSSQTSKLPPIRVLLVDDHEMFRKGLLKLLERYQDLEIVGEANDGAEAVVLAARLMPDVVIMDNNMPKLNGIEATRQIRRALPAIQVIGLSMHDGKEIRAAMLEAGAVDYLQKTGAVKELYQAICAVFPKPA